MASWFATPTPVPTVGYGEIRFVYTPSDSWDFMIAIEDHKEPGPWVLHFDPELCAPAEPGTLVCHRRLPKGTSK